MQFFPVANSTADMFQDVVTSAAGKASATIGGDFGTVLSSFIEEGRTDYTGLPEGFSALVQESGTVNRDTMNSFKQALRERDVSESALDMLDQIAASGMPATVGRIFSVLGGNSRLSEPLMGEERTNFLQLMGKIGFTKEEGEELIGMLDEGKSVKAWEKISKKLKDAGEGVDVLKTEMAALVKGLDLSESAQKKLMAAFGDQESLALNSEKLQKILNDTNNLMADKELGQREARITMREAMAQVLEQKKIKDKTDPVADLRGSRQTERMEALMQENILKKATETLAGRDEESVNKSADKAVNQASSPNSKQDAKTDSKLDAKDAGNEQDANPRDRKDGKSRAERILATAKDNTAESGKTDGKNRHTAETAVDRMMQRIDVAAANNQQTSATGSNAPAQDLNSMGRGFRQEIFSQVENGMMQNLQNGSRQLTLQLNPENLGAVTVILSVHQGEVKAHIRTENVDTAAVLQESMAELKASLEAQGLKVKEIDVQAQLQDNSLANQWDGTREHNLSRDAQEQARMERLSKMRRQAGAGNAAEQQATVHYSKAAENGLHIVA